MQAVCSGFVYALATADNFIKRGQVDTVLVIGAETFSRILDWEDRGTCVLFGDGAGAVVLKGEDGQGTTRRPRRPVDPSAFGRAPARPAVRRRRAVVDHRPGRLPAHGGREVFRQAVVKMAEPSMVEALGPTT